MSNFEIDSTEWELPLGLNFQEFNKRSFYWGIISTQIGNYFIKIMITTTMN